MAEINTSPAVNRHHSGKKMVKKSTNVDLTPMVDLGFLLITFFVFTTAMTKPVAMKMIMPKADDLNTNLASSKVLTVIPSHDNVVYYYEGDIPQVPQFSFTENGAAGLRKIILEKKKDIIAKTGSNEMKIIIRPAADCNYKNFVAVLDEITIDDIKIYFLDELTSAEKQKLPQ